MSDGIMLTIGADGVARQYDDTYDITIHCESEEEQRELMDRLGHVRIPEPEITHEKAIEFLQATGWLQNHDREMTLYGAKQSTDDPDLAAIKAAALQAGFEGKEVRFYIGGRLFAIRELPG